MQTTTTTPAAGAEKPSAPASTEQSIYAGLFRFFRGKGFTVRNAQVAAAAFLGNFKIESGWDPKAYNPGENAHGYAQWENGRWSGPHGLQAYAAAHHQGATTNAAEQGYLGYELTHGYTGVVENLRGQLNIDAAAQIVQSQFEGSTPDSLGARQAAARNALTDIMQGRPLRGGPLSARTPGGLGSTAGSSSGGGGGAGGGSGSEGWSVTGALGLDSVGEWVSKLVESALFVVLGMVLFITGIVILAKSAGVDVHTDTGTPPPAKPAGKAGHPAIRDAAKAAAV